MSLKCDKLVFSGFKTSIPLGIGETYDSGLLTLRGYTQVQTEIKSDTDGTIFVDFISNPSGTIIRQLTVPYTGGSGYQLFCAPAFSDYVRYKFTNGAIAQSEFYYQTKFLTTSVNAQILGVESFIASNMTSALNRSVIVAKNPLGNYENVRSDLDNKLLISNGIDSLYGESIDVTYVPIVQTSHFYGIAINPQLHNSFTASSGTITPSTDGNSVLLNIDTSVGSFAVLRSSRVLKYRHGYANICRVSGKFSTGVANSLQFVGVGNAVSDFYFSMTGTSFGIRKSTGGLLHVHAFTVNTGADGTETNVSIVLNGVSFPITLTDSSTVPLGTDPQSFTAHQIEIGGSPPPPAVPTVYTGWNVEHIGNVVYFIADAVGDRNDTYAFNSTGGTASVSHSLVKAGQNLTTTFVEQANWNGSSNLKNTLDPTKFNLYEIVYSWFGIANIEYRVYNNITGRFETVHKLTFSNGDDLSTTSANMFVQQGVANISKTTPLTNGLTLESTGEFTGTLGNFNLRKQPKNSASVTKTNITTETVLIVCSNRKQINGFPNQSELILDRIGIAVDGTKPVVIKIIRNPDELSNNTTTNFTNNILESPTDLLIYDVNTSSYTGGTVLQTLIIPRDGGETVDLFDQEIFLGTDDTLIVTAQSSIANNVTVSVQFISDI